MPNTPHPTSETHGWKRALLTATIASPAAGSDAQDRIIQQAEQMADKIMGRNGL